MSDFKLFLKRIEKEKRTQEEYLEIFKANFKGRMEMLELVWDYVAQEIEKENKKESKQ